MAAKPVPIPPTRTSAARIQRHKPVEVTALVASRPLSIGELNRVSRVLAAAGLGDMRPTRIALTPSDAQSVSEGNGRPVSATIVWDKHDRVGRARRQDDALTGALAAARSRGAAVKEGLLSDPDMLSTAGIAELLGGRRCHS